MIFSDLPSPAEASSRNRGRCQGFAQAGNRDPLFGIMLLRATITGKFRRAKREGDMKIGGWTACALLALTSLAQAQQFPTRPVTLIVPWPAGGSTDIGMRAL